MKVEPVTDEWTYIVVDNGEYYRVQWDTRRKIPFIYSIGKF